MPDDACSVSLFLLGVLVWFYTVISFCSDGFPSGWSLIFHESGNWSNRSTSPLHLKNFAGVIQAETCLGSLCYKLFTERKSWWDAATTCQSIPCMYTTRRCWCPNRWDFCSMQLSLSPLEIKQIARLSVYCSLFSFKTKDKKYEYMFASVHSSHDPFARFRHPCRTSGD